MLGVILCFAPSCRKTTPSEAGTSEQKQQRPVIVTSTTMVTDLVSEIAGEFFDVQPLMAPGVDPHSFKPSAEDMAKMQHARLIICSGLQLEEKMTDSLRSLRGMDKTIFQLGDGLPVSKLIKTEGSPDPHIWEDANVWSLTVPGVVKILGEIMPSQSEVFRKRGREVVSNLLATQEKIKAQMDRLPRRSRFLLTSHDGFRYFGAAYGLEVMGVQGASTNTPAGEAEIARAVEFIKVRRVRAIFVESSISPATVQRIIKETGVTLGGELLGDTLGQPGEMIQLENGTQVDRGTVAGMLQANLNTIITAVSTADTPATAPATP
jgi:manganese/zinc/iron transport system substrate-binding protein